jgi:hypothetical protein
MDTCQIIILISIMLGSGIFGGFVRYYLDLNSEQSKNTDGQQETKWKWLTEYIKKNDEISKPAEKKPSLLRSIIIGTAGSFIVPLFMTVITSGISQSKETPTFAGWNYLVFAGFCLIASIYAERFISTISDSILKQVDKKLNQAKEETDKTVNEKITEHKEDINETVKSGIASATGKVMSSAPEEIPGLKFRGETDNYETNMASNDHLRGKKVENDIQKNQWGGQSKRNGRELKAEISMIKKYDYNIKLMVVSTDKKNPLAGFVDFYLHDTFGLKDNKVRRPVENNTAELTLRAYSGFTVGAVCDNGKTWLELDLCELPNLPEGFTDY